MTSPMKTTMTTTDKANVRAVRMIRATYNISLSEAVAMWRRMSPKAKATWTA